jgi:tetratricopeptide (TPR) repeat protein
MGIFSGKDILSWAGTILLLHTSFISADETFDKLFNDRKYGDAIKYADEKIPIGSRDAAIWAKLGVANEGTELIEKALACYMVAIRNDANNYEAQLGAARVYNTMNQPEQAVEIAQKATAIKATGEASWEYARALIALKRTKEAKGPLEKLVETDKKNAVANRELGNIYYNDKEYAKALPLLQLTQAAQPSGETAAKIGAIYQNNQNVDSAIYFFREASKDKQFKNPDVMLQLARLLFKKEQFKDAAQTYPLVEQGMLKGDDLYNYALSLEKSGEELPKVITAYEAADRVIGKNGSKAALLGKEKIGRFKIEKKSYQDALDIFMAILKADPAGKIVSDATFLAAEAYDGMGDISKAIPLLEQVVTKDSENVEAHARLADYYQKSGDKEKAQKIFERLLTIQPDNPKVYMSLGEYSIKTKKWEDALKYFQKGFNLEKNAAAAEGMMNAAMELKRYDLARDAAETALHHDSTLVKPQLALAQINMQENNFAAASKILENLSKSDPKNTKFLQQLAQCYEKTKDTEKLAAVDKQLIGIDKRDVVSRVRYSNYLREKGNNEEAYGILQDLSSLRPKDADVIYDLYCVATKLGKKDQSANYLQKFVSLKPKDAKAQAALGDFYFDKADSVAALESYRNAIAADPAIKGFYKKYATLVMAQKPPSKPLPKGQKTPEEEVIDVLTAAVTAGEADEEIFTTLAEIYQKKSQYPKAIDMYQKALQKKPQSFDLLSSLAYCQQKGGRDADAILSFEQAVAMNGAAEKEYKTLGALYIKQGKKEQGITAYKKYIEKTKDDAVALAVGSYEYDQKDYKEAVKYLGMVTGNASRKSDYLLMYAESAFKTGDVPKAEGIYKQLVVVSPKSPEPFKTLFEIAQNKKDMKAAAEYLTGYTALKSDDIEMLKLLGDINYDLKNNAGAFAAYSAVLKVKPDAKGFYKKYVELVTAQGTPEEKVKALSGAIAAGEADVSMYAEMGISYLKAKDYGKAIQALDKATQLDPKNYSLLISLAQAQAGSGANEMALITYEQAVAMNPAADKEYKALGDLYMKQKKAENAIKAYKKYLEKSTDDSVAGVIGKFSLDSKNYSDAVKYFGMVKGKESESTAFLLLYASACFEAKEDQIAIKIYKKIADIQPQNAEIFRTLYELSKRTGADSDALISLKKYASLKPADAAYQKILGDKLYEQKDNEGAATAYRAALKADPKIKGFYKALVSLIMSTAKDEELIVVLNGAIDAGEADIAMYSRLGDIYRKQGNSAKAVTMFEKASQLDPKNVGLLSGLAEAQAKSGNVSGAILTYEQYLAMNISADKEYKALGDLYVQQKKNESAVKNYRKYLEKNSDSKIARFVGDFLLDTKAFADAVKYYDMVSGSDSENAEFLKKYGNAALQANDETKTYSIYKRLVLKTPQDADIFKSLYQIALKNGTKDETLNFLRGYTQLRPNDVDAQKTLGDMLYEKRDSRGALVAYRLVLKANPSAKGFYKRYAELVIAQEPPKVYAKGEKTLEEEIIDVLTAAAAAGEADVSMYRKLGVFYEKSKQYAKAVQTYEKASQLDPKDLSLLKDLAEAQVKNNNISGAILTYEQAVAMNPASVNEYKELGDLYKMQKKQDVAIKNYIKYLEKKKDNQLAVEVGSFSYDQKNYTDAVKYLGMVDGAEAGKASTVKLYADASYAAKDDFKAYQLFKQLATLTPQDPDVFKRLYDVAGRAGTKEDVLTYLMKYTALKSSDVEAQKTLGDMLYEKKNSSGALAAYSAVLKANPAAKGFYKNYVELLLSSGAQGSVLETALNGAIAAGEADVNMYKMLGGIYAKNNNFVKAVQMYEKSSQLDPKSVELITALADCQAKSGNISAAVLTYEQAIAMNPAASKEFKMLGDLYSKQKKDDAAAKNYKKYLEKNADNKLAAQIGTFELGRKDYKEAVKYLGMVTGPTADSAAHLKAYSEASRLSGDEMKAYQISKKLASVTPGDADVFKMLYQLAAKVGTKDEILTFLKAYTKLRVNDADAQKDLADMLYEKGDNTNALLSYRGAIKASPSIKGFYKKYVELVIKEGKDAEIINAINGAITAGEASVDMYSRCGMIFRKLGNPSKAVQMYIKASQLDPKDASLLVDLAESQVANKDTTSAILTYEQAAAMNPQAERELKALGDLYAGQKKRDSAVRVYKKYLEKAQDNAVAKLVGEHYFDQKNYPEAIKYFAMVTGSGSAEPDFLKKYATSSLMARDEFKAYQLFKQLSNINSKDPDVFEKLSDLATRVGTKDEVTNYLKFYTSLKPSDAKAQRTLGDLLYEKKDEAGALNAYRLALKADSTLKGFYSKYASLVMNSGSEDEKTKALEGAAAAGESDAKMYAMLGDIYSRKGNLAQAIASFEKAARLDPKNPGLLSSLAACQVKKGSVTEAIMTYEQVVAMDPRAEKEFKSLGDLYMSQKKADPALKAYKRYLEKDPMDEAVSAIVGEEAFKTKNYTDAVKYLSKVTGKSGKTVGFLQMYGEAALNANDLPRALIVYKELSTLVPKDPLVVKKLYEVSKQSGAREDALTYLRKYTLFAPKDDNAQKELGDILFDKNDSDGALRAYSAALTANPSAKGFYKKYVKLVLESKTATPAVKTAALAGAIKAGEADAAIYIETGKMNLNLKNYLKAIEMFESAAKLDPKNGEILGFLADAQMKNGSYTEAAITFEQALAMNPGAVREYKMLGDLYMKQKKTDAAMTAYRKYVEKSPSDEAIAKMVGEYFYDSRKFSDAYRYFSMVKSDKSADFLSEYGMCAIEVKQINQAIDILEELRSNKSTAVAANGAAYKALADAYEKNGDKKKAAEVLNDYVKIPGVKDPDASYKRAAVYETINSNLAVQMYEQNAVAYPKDYRNMLKLGVFYSRQASDAQKAVKYLEKCAAITDTIARVWLELGSLYGKMSRDQDMLRAYRKFIEIDPENAEATGKIGEVLLSRNMIDDAMVFLEMANSLKADDPKIMTLLARGYIMTNRKREGAGLLEKVVRNTKGTVDDELRIVLADFYIESSDYVKAVEELKTIISKKKDTAVMIKYAKVLIEMQRYSDASMVLQEIKTKEPENLDALMMLGKIKVAQKKYDDAVETYKEILYIDQNHAPALCERANVYMLQGKTQWAQTFYDRALKANPKYALTYLGLARIAKKDKDYAVYQDYLEKARKLDPHDKDIQDELKSVKR